LDADQPDELRYGGAHSRLALELKMVAPAADGTDIPATAQPSIETIVVSFNSGASLLRCCDALCGEAGVVRVHVVDNTPGGNDARLVESKASIVDCVSLSVPGGNRGFGPAINSALPEVDSEFVALVNPDGIFEPGALERLARVLASEPDAVLAGARLMGHDGVEQKGSRRREPTPKRLIANTLVRAFGLRRWYGAGFEMSDAPLPDGPVAVDAVSGACMVARTEALRAIGGFDERFFLHFEDLDVCKRLRDAGGEILFVPDAVFRHEGGGSSASRPYFVIRHKHLSMVKYYFKHYRRIGSGGLWLPLIVPMAALRCGVLMCRRLLSGSADEGAV
jgi:GT2 family glycosyltransferase